MNTYLQRWHSTIVQFITIQLFLTLISMPIIISWGLPISLLAPLGNALFSPVLTLFLLLSSLIFFTELIHIPNNWLIWILEIITLCWQKVLSIHVGSLMVGFKKPHWLFLLAMPLITFGSLYAPFNRKPLFRMMWYSGLFIFFWILLKISVHPSQSFSIPCNKGKVDIIQTKDSIIVMDYGAIGARMSAPSYVSYTLIPEIIKKTGSLTIDHLILTKPGIFLFEALEPFVEKMEIHTIYLPYLEGTMDEKLKRIFNRFYRMAKQRGTRIISCAKIPKTIYEKEVEIKITPETETTYRALSYRALKINCTFLNAEKTS